MRPNEYVLHGVTESRVVRHAVSVGASRVSRPRRSYSYVVVPTGSVIVARRPIPKRLAVASSYDQRTVSAVGVPGGAGSSSPRDGGGGGATACASETAVTMRFSAS